MDPSPRLVAPGNSDALASRAVLPPPPAGHTLFCCLLMDPYVQWMQINPCPGVSGRFLGDKTSRGEDASAA